MYTNHILLFTFIVFHVFVVKPFLTIHLENKVFFSFVLYVFVSCSS